MHIHTQQLDEEHKLLEQELDATRESLNHEEEAASLLRSDIISTKETHVEQLGSVKLQLKTV